MMFCFKAKPFLIIRTRKRKFGNYNFVLLKQNLLVLNEQNQILHSINTFPSVTSWWCMYIGYLLVLQFIAAAMDVQC